MDFPSELFKRFGLRGILCTIVLASAIWFLAHVSAAPRTEVSVLWGVVRNTKQGEKGDGDGVNTSQAKRAERIANLLVHSEPKPSPIQVHSEDNVDTQTAETGSRQVLQQAADSTDPQSPKGETNSAKENAESWRANQQLLKAIDAGDQSSLIAAIRSSANPNICQSKAGKIRCALAIACSKRDPVIVQLLLDAGADACGPLSDNDPIKEAVINDQPLSVRALLKAGANIKARIVAESAWANSNDNRITAMNEFPLLVYAAERGSLAMVKVLVDAGADIEEKDSPRGYSALIVCGGRGNGIHTFLLERLYPR